MTWSKSVAEPRPGRVMRVRITPTWRPQAPAPAPARPYLHRDNVIVSYPGDLSLVRVDWELA
ncbi:hypothetical protein, partial [Streptomyces hirsutus]|uniref:hypothetical protein n=1 Tax=Streptomyces hirsutus TaxID=35620 RepID=UPI003322DD38